MLSLDFFGEDMKRKKRGEKRREEKTIRTSHVARCPIRMIADGLLLLRLVYLGGGGGGE